MAALVPARPKIYHILHVDRLPSIVAHGGLVSDVATTEGDFAGTTIGMTEIKARRKELALRSRPGLRVGECVPFYFAPRSVMLHSISVRNSRLAYKGGQAPIIHLEADLYEAIAWAESANRRWAFTTSNAGSRHFADYADARALNLINWDAVQAQYWADVRDEKQAEFLMEGFFPWHLVDRIGCQTRRAKFWVTRNISTAGDRPPVKVMPEWYYRERRR